MIAPVLADPRRDRGIDPDQLVECLADDRELALHRQRAAWLIGIGLEVWRSVKRSVRSIACSMS